MGAMSRPRVGGAGAPAPATPPEAIPESAGTVGAKAKTDALVQAGDRNLAQLKKRTGTGDPIFDAVMSGKTDDVVAASKARRIARAGGTPPMEAAVSDKIISDVAGRRGPTGPDDMGKRFAGRPQIPRPEGVDTAGDQDAKYRDALTAKGDTEGAARYTPGPNNWRNSAEGRSAHQDLISAIGDTRRTAKPDPLYNEDGTPTPELVERQAKRQEQIAANKNKNRNLAVAKGRATPEAVAQFRREGLFGDELKKADPIADALLSDPTIARTPGATRDVVAGALGNRHVGGLTPKEQAEIEDRKAERAQRGEQFKGELGFKRENLEATRDMAMQKLKQEYDLSMKAEERMRTAGDDARADRERQHRENMYQQESARITTEYGNKLKERDLTQTYELENRKLEMGDRKMEEESPLNAAIMEDTRKLTPEKRVQNLGIHPAMTFSELQSAMRKGFVTENELQDIVDKSDPMFPGLVPSGEADTRRTIKHNAQTALVILRNGRKAASDAARRKSRRSEE